jgi:hypothetical protein
MDGIVSSKPVRSEELVEELHQQIMKKNHSILELEKRYNKLISILSESKEAGADLEKVIEMILNDDISEIDYVLEHSRKKAIEVLLVDETFEEQVQNLPQLEFHV